MIVNLKSVDDVRNFVPVDDWIYVDDVGVEFTGKELDYYIHCGSYDYDTFIGSYVVRG